MIQMVIIILVLDCNIIRVVTVIITILFSMIGEGNYNMNYHDMNIHKNNSDNIIMTVKGNRNSNLVYST